MGSSIKMEAVRACLHSKPLQMSWDFAESNPWGGSGGDFVEDLLWISRVLDNCSGGQLGIAQQSSAGDCGFDGQLISTDPPYYDNIGYSDLSDFFMFGYAVRFSPSAQLLSTMLVPKAEELVANPYRHGGKDGAHEFSSKVSGTFFGARQIRPS